MLRIMRYSRRSGQRTPLTDRCRMEHAVKEQEGEHKKSGDNPEIFSHTAAFSLLLRQSFPSEVFYWIPFCSAIPCLLSN